MKLRIFLLSVVAMAMLAGCGPRKPRYAAFRGEDRRECPHDWNFDSLSINDTIWGEQGHGEIIALPRVLTTVRGQAQLPGDLQNIVEFHDCQRFIVRDAETEHLEYDSLYAIFAANKLDSIVENLRPDSARSVALIYSEGEYEHLGIEDRFNCLYLYRSEDSWGARMVPVGGEAGACMTAIDPFDPDYPGTNLFVNRETSRRQYPDSLYPPVARWDWDETNEQQYIGIKCGAAWCEIGQRTQAWSATRSDLHSGSTRPGIHVYDIKGWYDEQYLATYVNGQLETTPIKGTIIPDPALDAYELVHFQHATWLPAAEVVLAGPAAWDQAYFATNFEYKRRFNLDLTSAGAERNQIEMCLETANGNSQDASSSRCDIPEDLVITSCDDRVSFSGDVDVRTWWARIEGMSAAGGREYKYKCLTRYLFNAETMPDHVPGTVRWRWLANDEGGWMRCTHGCCELL